jgi:hypothetical protein
MSSHVRQWIALGCTLLPRPGTLLIGWPLDILDFTRGKSADRIHRAERVVSVNFLERLSQGGSLLLVHFGCSDNASVGAVLSREVTRVKMDVIRSGLLEVEVYVVHECAGGSFGEEGCDSMRGLPAVLADDKLRLMARILCGNLLPDLMDLGCGTVDGD